MRSTAIGLGVLALVGCADSSNFEADTGTFDAAGSDAAATVDTGGALPRDAGPDASSRGTLYAFDTSRYSGPNRPLDLTFEVLLFPVSTDSPRQTVARGAPGDLTVMGWRAGCRGMAVDFLEPTDTAGVRSVAPAHLVEVGIDVSDQEDHDAGRETDPNFCISYRVRGEWHAQTFVSFTWHPEPVTHVRKKVDVADVDAVAIFYPHTHLTVHGVSYRLEESEP